MVVGYMKTLALRGCQELRKERKSALETYIVRLGGESHVRLERDSPAPSLPLSPSQKKHNS